MAPHAGMGWADPVRLASAALASLALACVGAPQRPALPEGLDREAARATLARFAHDLRQARWDDALALLSARWRAGTTPGRVATDFAGAGPGAREAADRVLAALAAGAPLELEGGRARLPVGPGRAAVLVAEGGSWRVDALE